MKLWLYFIVRGWGVITSRWFRVETGERIKDNLMKTLEWVFYFMFNFLSKIIILVILVVLAAISAVLGAILWLFLKVFPSSPLNQGRQKNIPLDFIQELLKPENALPV
jgi:hypothetical protein